MFAIFVDVNVYSIICLYYPFIQSDILALDLEGVHDVKLHHPSSSVATSNQ